MFDFGPQPETSELFFQREPVGKEIQFTQKFYSSSVLLLGKLQI